MTRAEAKAYRKAIVSGAASLTDAEAITAPKLFERWENYTEFTADDIANDLRIVGDDGKLYRIKQAHTRQEEWLPSITPSLYERVGDGYSGTIDDPIPYDGNMTLENGKYYSQDGVTYLCTRDTGIAVYNPLVDLVGLYVVVAEE